ncbi:MAG TPA: polysaccharide biosynthesis tyrosine autokinase [Pirellulales bacterium]|jgi:succinoglycan biosynthesis transport protein ExoP|nr:polysaccharide biosynthesis tyrosine autokinase [Pirellulales bacterium]
MSGDAFSEASDSGQSQPSSDSNGNGHGHETNGSPNGSTNGMLAPIDNRLPAIPTVGWSYGPPAKPEILKSKPNPVELMHAARRRWPLAIGLGLAVGGTAAALLWYFLPVRYEAFALLKVAERPPAVLDKAATAAEEFAVFKRTQVQLILSNIVLTGTLRDSTINRLDTLKEHADDQVAWLKDQLVIDYPDDAEIMRVAMKGKRKDDITKIVNKIIDVYMKEIVAAEREQRAQHEGKLETSFQRMNQEVQTMTEALKTLENLHKTAGSDSARILKEMAIEQLSTYVQQSKQIHHDREENRMKIMLAETRRDNPEETRPPDVLIEMKLNEDPQVISASNLLANFKDALAQARSKSKGKPTNNIKKIQERIGQLEERIEERKNELRPNLVESLANGWTGMAGMPINHDANLTLPVLEKQRDFLEQRAKDTEDKIEQQTDLVGKMDQHSTVVAAKQDELAAKRRIASELKMQLDRAHVESLAPERIKKQDDAILANSNGDAMRKYVALAFTFVFGFGLMAVSVAFIEFQARKVNSVSEVNDGLGIRVVGELPNVSGRVWRRIRGGKGPSVLKALMAERIDSTRTALIHTSSIDPPRVVMVTSADPHEGKTTTATQLAASLARSGRRTLLVDADIRNPGAHRVFALPQDPGLCEMLRGEADRDAVIHPTRTANLWLLPAGRCDLRSVQALSTSYLGTAIAGLCVQFDYVVIDSGPVLKIADPLLIGQHVDAAIVSVLRDQSKVPHVYEACERLRSVGITVLGSVVNGVKDDAARHGVELLMAETEHAAQAEAASV